MLSRPSKNGLKTGLECYNKMFISMMEEQTEYIKLPPLIILRYLCLTSQSLGSVRLVTYPESSEAPL